MGAGEQMKCFQLAPTAGVCIHGHLVQEHTEPITGLFRFVHKASVCTQALHVQTHAYCNLTEKGENNLKRIG